MPRSPIEISKELSTALETLAAEKKNLIEAQNKHADAEQACIDLQKELSESMVCMTCKTPKTEAPKSKVTEAPKPKATESKATEVPMSKATEAPKSKTIEERRFLQVLLTPKAPKVPKPKVPESKAPESKTCEDSSLITEKELFDCFHNAVLCGKEGQKTKNEIFLFVPLSLVKKSPKEIIDFWRKVYGLCGKIEFMKLIVVERHIKTEDGTIVVKLRNGVPLQCTKPEHMTVAFHFYLMKRCLKKPDVQKSPAYNMLVEMKETLGQELATLNRSAPHKPQTLGDAAECGGKPHCESIARVSRKTEKPVRDVSKKPTKITNRFSLLSDDETGKAIEALVSATTELAKKPTEEPTAKLFEVTKPWGDACTEDLK